MKHVIDFFFREKNEVRNVVLDELEMFVAGEVTDVGHVAGDQIVDRDDAMPFGQQTIDQMRAEKTGAAGDDGDRVRISLGHWCGLSNGSRERLPAGSQPNEK